MEYSILLPCDYILSQWYNIGIDFWPMHITANRRISGEEAVLVKLRDFAIELDNRYVKGYTITQPMSGWIEIKIKV